MSDIISIKELFEGVEVEWKLLENVADFRNGKGHEKNIVEDAKYIVVNSKFISSDGKFVKYSDKQICPIFTDEILIVMSDLPNGRALAKTYIVKENDKYTLNQRIGGISVKDKTKLLPKFLSYLLNRTPQLLKYNNGIDQTNLRKQQILNVQIPIIPLQVQKEIVKTLDNFTELTAELTAELATELTARRIQYNYYLDRLLNFKDEQIEWKTFKEVTLSTRNIKWKDTNYTYRYIDLASVSREKNLIMETFKITANNAPSRAKKIVEKNDVIFATTRPTQQRFCLIDDEYSGEIASTGYCILRAKSNKVLPKWIYYHVSSSNFKNYVDENQSGSAYPAISDAKVKDFLIPIPTIKEQEQIVSILDKLETLTISIIEGLPKEIKLRQQQYEYYRDLLLTFPKNDVEV